MNAALLDNRFWSFPTRHGGHTEAPKLTSQDVHVWRVALDIPESEIDSLASHLSDDELARAARFRFDVHRRRFIACRGQLRRVLATYSGTPSQALRFRYGPYGKPSLDSEPSNTALRFNLSHSHELALIAVALNIEVGVDVEFTRDLNDIEQLARRFFTPDEYETVRAQKPPERDVFFFHGWTRKEALMKAEGRGFSLPPEQIEVTLTPSAPVRVLAMPGDSNPTANWSLLSLLPAPGYIGTLAYRGPEREIHLWCSGPANFARQI
jgi:4'-phosphopantetheinyl transferase